MCEVNRKGFVTILSDNDEVFFNRLIGIIESVDEYASIQITNAISKFNFRIAPSTSQYVEPLLQEVLKLNNMFGIHLDLGKSMKASSTITFNVEL